MNPLLEELKPIKVTASTEVLRAQADARNLNRALKKRNSLLQAQLNHSEELRKKLKAAQSKTEKEWSAALANASQLGEALHGKGGLMQLIQALAADKGTLEEQLLERTRSLEACVATVEAQHQELLAAVVTVKAESQQRMIKFFFSTKIHFFSTSI